MAEHGSGGIRRFRLLGATIACGGVALALPSVAGAIPLNISIGNGMMAVTGSDGPDHTTIRIKPNQNGSVVIQVYDPDGIPDPIPPGCTRKDANTVICPGSIVQEGITLRGGDGDDEIIFDLPVPPDEMTFTSSSVANFVTGFTATANGGGGNDTMADLGPLGSTQIGGPGNDTQQGGGGNDVQIGGPGNDQQSGQGGNDGMSGGAGDDKLRGGAGADKLKCGSGEDTGNGGGGNDKAKGCEKGKA